MKNIYCTLFSYDYIARGLALYESMVNNIKRFRLYILAMDMKTKDILDTFNLESAIILYYEDIISQDIMTILRDRTGPSFYWSFTPILIENILLKRREEWCTYVDADCYFFGNPENVFDIINDGYSVGIVEHHYRRDDNYRKWIERNGRYNVAFNTFRNESNSLSILKNWKQECLDNCSDRPTGEVFGDQLYLNTWPQEYRGVYVVQEEGIDVAPWNVNNYLVYRNSDNEYMIRSKDIDTKIIMFHFHALSFVSKHLVSINLWNPKTRSENKVLFELYKEYICKLRKQQSIVDSFGVNNGNRRTNRLKGLLLKISERSDKNIINFLRNIVWV